MLHLTGGLQTPLPDLSAFEADSSIEQKKRSQKRMHFPPPGAAVPAGPTAGVAAAAPSAGPYHFNGAQAVPAFLSSSQGRPVCPSTPMKSPGMSKLFSGSMATATHGQQHQQQFGTPMCSPTQHALSTGMNSVSASARRKGRAAHGLQQATPYSRASSGSATPRAPKRSNSGELLAALSRQPGGGGSSGATSPERRAMGGGGMTPLSTSHSSDSEGGSSLCSSVAHSPLMDTFMFTPSAPATGARDPFSSATGTHSLASSFNSNSGRFALGFGLMGSGGSSAAPSSAVSSHNGIGGGMHSLSMSHGRTPHHPHPHHHHSNQQQLPPPTIPRRISTSSLAPAHAQSHFASSFLNLGCIGRGSFGECFHVLQTSPRPSSHGLGQEFAVKKSIRPFKGENDRNQKLREVENWRLLMNSSGAAAQQSQLQLQMQHDGPSTSTGAEPQSGAPSSPPSPAIDPSHDHLHLVRLYSSWEEQGHLYIQSELLRGGTCRRYLDEALDGPADEEMLWLFLLDLARGVRFIHQKARLIHLDLKWDNIFIATAAASSATGADGAAGSAADEPVTTGILKIGDFGLSLNVQERAAHVRSLETAAASAAPLHASAFPPSCDPAQASALASPSAAQTQAQAHSSSASEWADDDEDGGATSTRLASLLASAAPEIAEGDQTYLAPEFMDPGLRAPAGGAITTAADVFSLGIMMFEAAFDVELPRRGLGWIDLRNERIDWSGRSYLSGGAGAAAAAVTTTRSPELLSLIRRMLRRDPAARPSIEEVLSDPTLRAFARGERGAPQRALLRSLPSILAPAAEAHAAARARVQAVAAGAALGGVLQAPECEWEEDLMRGPGRPTAAATASAFAASSAAASAAVPAFAAPPATAARLPSSRRGSARLGGGATAPSSGPVAPLLPLLPLPSFDGGASSSSSAMEDTLPPKNLFDSFQCAGDD